MDISSYSNERILNTIKQSYNFDADGNETKIDYAKMLQIVKDAGDTGFIGVEYEGDEKSEQDGIIATRDLLVNAAKNLK